MARLPFVDTHVHFYDFSRDDLRWAWLEPEFIHPLLGNIDAIKARLFAADEFIAETRFANVSKVVHVQAALGSEKPVNETRWLQEMADAGSGVPQAIVAECHLAQDDAEAVLAEHAQYANVRGIRDFGTGDYLIDPAWQRGYKAMGRYGWVCALDSDPDHYHQAAELARAVPDVTLCLDHAGFPRHRDDEYFEHWRASLKPLAACENAVIKISGLGMCDPQWTIDSLRRWVDTCIESFGVDRSFFGTNWPVDRLFSSYPDVVDAYAELISGYSESEQVALFSGNAERVFRI
jgi:predicted TIM-barrel fold metal-dependent hydrolase